MFFSRRRFLLLSAIATFLCSSIALGSTAFAKEFEVWLVDQSNTNGMAFGGAIHIYDGDDLTGRSSRRTPRADVLDLSGATSSLCLAATGANPVRPHMLAFNSTHRHAVLSFVTSGHVVIFDATSRTPLACLRTSSGAAGARQAHAATPAPDDSYILVSNQNGKLLERIDANYETNTFALNTAATINLVTCLTPSGKPCEDLVLRPDNAPIVAIVDSTSSLGFITLRGGGLFVVDPTTTPMQIIGEYDSSVIHGNGFAGVETGGVMFVNSGGGTPAVLHKFDVYAFPLEGYDAANGPNAPMPHLLYSDDGAERDGHGMVLTQHQRFVWVLDRVQNVAEIFRARTGAHVNRVNLNRGGPAGLAPDLADISPSGDHIFVSLRGPNPLSGDPHASSGSTPGLGVIHVVRDGLSGRLERVVPIHNVDALGIERADAHGIRVRLTERPCKRGRECRPEHSERHHRGDR